MGEQLGATHLIEGSVRKAGDRVRITAQLIRADDGTHVWSENYDRQLTDIFAIQEEIARAIASSLRMPLGLEPGQNLVTSRNIDPETYQEFLRILAKERAGASDAGKRSKLWRNCSIAPRISPGLGLSCPTRIWEPQTVSTSRQSRWPKKCASNCRPCLIRPKRRRVRPSGSMPPRSLLTAPLSRSRSIGTIGSPRKIF